MKVSEMNAHQKVMFKLMDNVTSDYIGGWENTLEDYEEFTDEYKEAYEYLNMGHDKMKDFFYHIIMCNCKKGTYAEHARFAGGQFLMDIIERRLIKWCY